MSDELKEKRFTYEIEVDNGIMIGQFNTIGDEKIGDVIFRLENDLCIMINTETEEQMLTLKGMRKMVQYLKDHYKDQMHLDIMDLQKTLNKMKNENK